MRSFTAAALTLIFFSSVTSNAQEAAQPALDQRPNVLFIAVDDLRTNIGAYGDPIAKTPNIDMLANGGMLFERAYCQQAVCNPSRASLLTGRRPDTIRVWNLRTHFRDTTPDVVTLPEHFKNNGYRAVAYGKIFHGEKPLADPPSWSAPEAFEYVSRADEYQQPQNKGARGKFAAVEVTDLPDEAYPDAQAATAAIKELNATHERPLFLAVGFRKPHLPFTTPKKYWDLYDNLSIGGPPDAEAGAFIPQLALHPSAELRGYSDVPDVGQIEKEQAVALRRGYYACTSFTDAQIGRLLQALEKSRMAKNTIVVLWSDHGFHLGEKGLWAKTTNYEIDTRVPLIIRGPGVKVGGKTRSLAELVDVYPTLVDLAGLPMPPKLEGLSLRPVLEDPSRSVKDAAFSQFQRPFNAGSNSFDAMGYAVRTDGYRYVEWRDPKTNAVLARELYDEKADIAESRNLAGEASMAAQVEHHAALLPAIP